MLSFVIYSILVVLCALILINSIITLFTFLFLYIDHNLAAKRRQRVTPIKLTTLLDSYLLETLYVNAKYLLWPLKFFNFHKNLDLRDKQTDTDTIIVLVHGYGRNQTDWIWFQQRLAEAIKLPICAINLCPTMGSMQQIATTLQTELAKLQAKTKCTKIVLIGHSMGGLVSSYFSEFMDEQNIVTKVFLIGSPLRGTKLALLGYGINSRQMEPDTKFLTALLAKLQVSKKAYFYVASKLDNLIIPWDSCLPAESDAIERQFIVEKMSHQTLIHSRQVLDQIVKWLIT